MNITDINRIVSTRGQALALNSARAAQMADWIIRKLEAGAWDPNHKPAVETKSVFDRNGDKSLVMVKKAAKFVRFELLVKGESGDVTTTNLGAISATQARSVIGKVLSHSMPANAGKPTNDPTVSRNMKGSNGGGGDNKKGK